MGMIKWNDAAFKALRVSDPDIMDACEHVAQQIADRARAMSTNPWFESGIVVKRRTSRRRGGAGVIFYRAALEQEAKHGTITRAFNGT